MDAFDTSFLAELVKLSAVFRSRLTPQSSNVKGFSYDPKTQDLVITYKSGGTYRYAKVPPGVARSMSRNKSVGKTVHKRVKGGGYAYTKVAQKSYTCKMCKEPATKGVIWADGRAIVPACDKHLGKAKRSVSDIVTIRDLTKKAEPYDRTSSNATMMERHGETNFVVERVKSMLRERVREGGKAKKAAIVKTANGDMIAYYQAHPKKLEERRERVLAKAKTKYNKGNPRWGKHLNAQQRFAISRSGTVKKAEAAALAPEVEEQLPELPVPQLEQPIAKKVVLNLAEKAEKLAAAELASGVVSIMQGMRDKQRWIAKRAGAVKKTFTWGGLTMKFEVLKGDVRFKGMPHERIMKDHYGYMPGTYGKGADGEAIDVYFSPDPLDGPVFRVKQLRKGTGEFDEYKFMVGYGSEEVAQKAFLRNMPKWAFGSMTRMSMKAFRALVGQNERKIRVPSDGNAERDRVRKVLG